MQVINIENIETIEDKQTIFENNFYIFLKTLKKDLIIGPFISFEKADEYMKTKTTNIVRDKYIIEGKYLKQLLSDQII